MIHILLNLQIKSIRIASLIISTILFLSSCVIPNVKAEDYQSVYVQTAEQIIDFYKGSLNIDKDDDLFSDKYLSGVGTSLTDWYAIGLGRLGTSNSYYAYRSVATKYVEDKYKTDDKLDRINATEWHRIGLAILSCGGDPTCIGNESINLLSDGTYNRGKVMRLNAQGNNALIWGLIFMDAMRYNVPDDAINNRENIILSILKTQQSDGGFTLDKNSSPDCTGTVLQAFAPYYNSEQVFTYKKNSDDKECKKTVRKSVDDAVTYLSEIQQSNGGYIIDNEESCESIAQVIIGLCSVGINPSSDTRFIKNGNSLVDRLMRFKQSDGGFSHLITQNTSDAFASQQVLLALVSLERFNKRLHNLYDFRNEPNIAIKDLISDLDMQIENLEGQPNKDKVEELYNNYLKIPIGERSYVRNYSKLAELMCDNNIAEKSDEIFTLMNENNSANGYVFNIKDESEVNCVPRFTEDDKKQAYSYNGKLSENDKINFTVLLGKLQMAENRNDYKDVEKHLCKIIQNSKTSDKTNYLVAIVSIVGILLIISFSFVGYKYVKKSKITKGKK